MSKLKIVFLGTPELACGYLTRIAAAGYELAGVVSQPDRQVGRGLKFCCSPVCAQAEKMGVKFFKPASKQELHSVIAELKPDLCVVVAYGRLIPPETLALAKHGFLNVHFSLLPKYRGAAPVQWALINREPVTGVTLFWLDKGMDTGPVFLRREAPVLEEDDAASLFRRLTAAGEDLLLEGLAKLSAGELIREPQEGVPSSAPKFTAADALLDFSAPAAALLGRVRGLACGPRARFELELPDRKISVQALAAALPPAAAGAGALPGTILSVEAGGGFIVKCGVGELLLKSVKPEGKKEMSGADFLNGLRFKPGDSVRRH
ncbi:MAG TPA: methionyl-tRNA formyltransferase [Elusimicrobiales bacterium]|nr:methionyl-tRNA formyltransferase [Elusimicrobiales bacterium]